MLVRDEARRYARLLRQVVELSGISEREMERRLELGGGTLSRIFAGRVELKLYHLLAVLAEAGMKPERFFQLAAVVLEGASEESLGRQVLATLDRLAPVAAAAEPPAAAVTPATLTDEELDRRVEAALVRLGASRPAALAPIEPPSEPPAAARSKPARQRPRPAPRKPPAKPRGR